MERYKGEHDGGSERHLRMAAWWSFGKPADQCHCYPDHSHGEGKGFIEGGHHPY